MSHSKQRPQNNCLNCNAVTYGHFCHVCGQENVETKESAWHIVSHFFQDITHFDGKFFSTIRYLLLQPGFLSLEYMAGRRNSYLHPIRMYVFTSAFYFLFFFKFVGHIDQKKGDAEVMSAQVSQANMAIESLRQQKANPADTTMQRAIAVSLRLLEEKMAVQRTTLAALKISDSLTNARFTRRRDSIRVAAGKTNKGFSLVSDDEYTSVVAYDMVQSQLPPGRRDSWWQRLRLRKQAEIIEKNKTERNKFGMELGETFLHKLPQMFFVSLPLFAFGLWLLYRRHKQYFYANHAIFSIHLYCGVFIFSFVTMVVNLLLEKYNPGWAENITGIATLGIFFYLYKCMRHFYRQRRAKTILKFLLLSAYAVFILVLLSTGFAIFSLWNI